MFKLHLTVISLCLISCGSKQPSLPKNVSSQSYPGTTFKMTLTDHYLSAERGGGAGVTANKAVASNWETFTLVDLNGGDLKSGDEILLKTEQGYYVQASPGHPNALNASSKNPGAWETFYIGKSDGSSKIMDGSLIGLKAKEAGGWLSALNGGGGEVDSHGELLQGWERFRIGLTAGVAGNTTPPGDANKGVLAFLRNISGRATVAGQHNKEPNSDPSLWTRKIESVTGKSPGLWSGDFLFAGGDVSSRRTMIEEAKRQWQKGALVNLMWHACPPTTAPACPWEGGVVGGLSNDQWQELITDGSRLNRVWKSRLDTIAIHLEDLKQAGVQPMFRPFHEMNQKAFWWGGRKGPNGTARLYELTHDYLVKAKGLTNIVWVWNIQDLDHSWADYKPRDDTWDLMTLDVYDKNLYTQKNYDLMLQLAKGKPIGIGECKTLPSLEVLKAQPKWVFFMGWAELTTMHNSAIAIRALYSSDQTLTREEVAKLR